MSHTTIVALITAVAVLSAVVWFDCRLLADLARTSDRDLRVFDRGTWALMIVITFPVGPMLYLLYAKGPGRFANRGPGGSRRGRGRRPCGRRR